MLAFATALAGALFVYGMFIMALSLFKVGIALLRLFSISVFLADDYLGGIAGALTILLCVLILLKMP